VSGGREDSQILLVTRFDSSRSVIVEDEEKDTSLIPEKRTRLDSNSTDVEPSFELELDPPLRRDCFSPGVSRYRHKSASLGGPGGTMVPIFALSTKGSYYIPMSLDSSLLGSLQPLVLTEDSSGPFHPVTISVKFTNLQEPASLTQDSRNWRNQRRGVISNQQSVIKHWKDQPV